MKRPYQEVKHIGDVCVDSGQIIITDPCRMEELDYLKSCVTKRFDLDMKYMAGNGHWPRRKYTRLGMKELQTREIRDDVRNSTWGQGAPIAVVATSGWGDGVYPVFAELDDKGGVLSLTIDFQLGGYIGYVANEEAKRTRRNRKARCKRANKEQQ
jgi:hypothetical protein